MGYRGIADARRKLSELMDRVLEREDVIITRYGRPVVSLKSIAPLPKRPDKPAIQWLKHHRVGTRMPRTNSAAVVRRLRDAW